MSGLIYGDVIQGYRPHTLGLKTVIIRKPVSTYGIILCVFQLCLSLQLVIHELFLKLPKYGTDASPPPPNMLYFINVKTK